MSHHQPQHTGKPSHNNRQQHQQQHHQQSQSHPNYNPYEAHSQSGAYPESPYHSQSYKSPNQNYQNTYQQQGSVRIIFCSLDCSNISIKALPTKYRHARIDKHDGKFPTLWKSKL